MFSILFKILVPILLAPGISSIVYDKTGGRGGNTEHLSITRFSIYYTQGKAGKEKTLTEKISFANWNKLTASINLKNFDAIQSNPGHALYDGTDITITVVDGRSEHSIVNGNEDQVHYKNIAAFTRLLESHLERMRKKVTW